MTALTMQVQLKNLKNIPAAPLFAAILFSQRPKLTRKSPKTTIQTALASFCPASTHNSQMTVANNGKPKNFLKSSIQAPGLGKNFNSPGDKHSTTNGNAIPKPKNIKINIFTAAVCVSAKLKAVPIKGAVQGVATIVAKTPLKNASLKFI